MNRCPNCSGKMPAGRLNCPACGQALSPAEAGAKAMPRAYRRIRDPRRWVIGTSAGAILLGAALIAVTNHGFRVWDRYDEKQGREEAITRNSTRIDPGEVYLWEVVTTEAEGYSLSVLPYDAPCKAAFVYLGDAGAARSRDEVIRALRAEAVEVVRKQCRVIEGTTKVGRHAWGVWHDQPSPVRITVIYRDTRGRK